MASDMLRMTPSVRRTPTTSLAMVLIQAIATAKPMKHISWRHAGGRLGVVVRRMKASRIREAMRLYIVCLRSACGFSGSTLAHITRMMKNGDVKVWIMTSHLFHSLGSVDG